LQTVISKARNRLNLLKRLTGHTDLLLGLTHPMTTTRNYKSTRPLNHLQNTIAYYESHYPVPSANFTAIAAAALLFWKHYGEIHKAVL